MDFDYVALLPERYAHLLRRAGFSAASYYGGLDSAPYDEGSDRLIVVARA